GNGWLTTHEPDGEWLYGADLMVHPNYRRRGVGSALYRARRELVKKLNLRGEIAGGMLPGYERYRDQMSIETYVELVAQGELTDPTLSMQIHNGFRPRGILYNHITDPRSNDCAALIVRENPDYRP
ncbi:MAG: GNAT family N-acetyltransferase, partial [Chloroflexi bacterium]